MFGAKTLVLRPSLALLGVLLSACATGPEPWNVPTGSIVIVNESITVPGHSAHAVIQDGKTLSYWDVDRYAAHCLLEMKQRLASPQVVKPGRFTVIKNSQDINTTSVAPTLVASLLLAYSEEPSGFLNEMYLTSPDQPDVFRLTCRRYGFLDDTTLANRYTTIQQMQDALGKLITLQLSHPESDAPKK